jgi:hypothetical protein
MSLHDITRIAENDLKRLQEQLLLSLHRMPIFEGQRKFTKPDQNFVRFQGPDIHMDRGYTIFRDDYMLATEFGTRDLRVQVRWLDIDAVTMNEAHHVMLVERLLSGPPAENEELTKRILESL